MGKNTSFIVAIVMILLGYSTAGAFEVIKDGRIQVRGIVLRAEATSSEWRAAEEMAHHLAKAADGAVQVFIEGGASLPKGPCIFLGNCQANLRAGLRPEEMGGNCGVIVVDGEALRLAGKDEPNHYLSDDTSTGTLFAVYEFLENHLGVRWLWPGELGEYVPRPRNLSIPDGRVEVCPKLQSSLWRNVKSAYSGWRNRENMLRFKREQSDWLKRHRFSCDTSFQLGHAFQKYYQAYGKEHPEFFSLLPDGTRRPNPYSWSKDDPRCVSMCVTNPELVRHIVSEWSAEQPRTNRINLNENDSYGECVCPVCLAADNSPVPSDIRLERARKLFEQKSNAWVKELGSLSDRYCKFYLAVQREADKIDPTHQIMGLIYTNFSEPPSDGIKLNERITLRFCPPFMYPWTPEKISKYKENFGGWTKTGARLMFRPNFTWDGSYFPVLYQDVFYDLYTFSAPYLSAVDMDSLTGHYSVQGLVNFVIATLNHNRDISLDELKETFCSAFGAAKPLVREYLDYATKVSMDCEFHDRGESLPEGSGLYLEMFMVADKLFNSTVMAKCKALLDAALHTPGLDETESARVRFLESGLKNAELTMAAQSEYRRYQKKEAPINAFAKAVRELDDYRASIEHTNALNMGNIRFLEDRRWPERFKLYLVDVESDKLTDWRIAFDPKDQGVVKRWQMAEYNAPRTFPVTTRDASKKEVAALREKECGRDSPSTIWYFNRLEKVRCNGGKKCQLLFSSIYGNATVYLNGEQIFRREIAGDYSWWSWKDTILVDVPSSLMKPNGNLLAIRVDSDRNNAGIWHPVYCLYKTK
ncbi:MAG: DUF4838 domain-containing protein, partial [Victivallales bacterium]|nr:DUF4838 domain-containing protein [Victivallales bacterium]